MEEQDFNANNIMLRYDLKLNGNIIFEDQKDKQHLKELIEHINDSLNRYGGEFKIIEDKTVNGFHSLTIKIKLPQLDASRHNMCM